MYGSFRSDLFSSDDELEANLGPRKTLSGDLSQRVRELHSGRVIATILLLLLGLCAAPLAFHKSSKFGLGAAYFGFGDIAMVEEVTAEDVLLFEEHSAPCRGESCCHKLAYDSAMKTCVGENLGQFLNGSLLESKLSVSLPHFKVYSSEYGCERAVGLQYPWMKRAFRVAEPHRNASFELDPTTVALLTANYPDSRVMWTVQESDSSLLPPTMTYTSEMLGAEKSVPVKVTIYGDVLGKVELASHEDKFHILYVRRELRSLSNRDKSEYLQGMYDMYAIGGESGRAKFGENYQSMEELTALHLRIAGGEGCDHLHDGFGFTNAHVLITNIMEKSVQMMNPRTALPYWDYTIDGQVISDLFGSDVYSWSQNKSYNRVFSDEYYGMHDEFGDGTLIDSVFKDVMKVGKVKTATQIGNSYGYMHAPWNQVNSEKVTRAFTDSCFDSHELQYSKKHFPRCDDMEVVYETKEDFFEFMTSLPYVAHGSLHRYLGTTHQCSQLFRTLEDDYGLNKDAADALREKAFVTLKHLYHDGLLTVPTCDSATGMVVDDITGKVTDAKCSYLCPTLEDDLAGVGKNTLNDWMQSACGDDPDPSDPQSYNSSNVISWARYMTEEQQLAYIRSICYGAVEYGDHGTAASSADVSFWSVHPTVERFVQLNYFHNAAAGTVFNFSSQWPPTYVSWESFKYPECYGHHFSDKLLTLPSEVETSIMPTNEEFQAATNPLLLENDMNYIYDNIYYEHCADVPYFSDDYCTGVSCCGLGTYFDLELASCVSQF